MPEMALWGVFTEGKEKNLELCKNNQNRWCRGSGVSSSWVLSWVTCSHETDQSMPSKPGGFLGGVLSLNEGSAAVTAREWGAAAGESPALTRSSAVQPLRLGPRWGSFLTPTPRSSAFIWPQTWLHNVISGACVAIRPWEKPLCSRLVSIALSKPCINN